MYPTGFFCRGNQGDANLSSLPLYVQTQSFIDDGLLVTNLDDWDYI